MELIRINKTNHHIIHEEIVATIGQFDGLHLAHNILIEKTVKIANERKIKSAIFTFDPHPDLVLNKASKASYITPLNEKKDLLEKWGLDYMIVIEFNLEIANLEPQKFLEDYLVANQVVEVVVGFDFTYGKAGAGKAQMIESLTNGKIKVNIIDEIKYNDEKIGTTQIKSLLAKGKVMDVANLLGRYYQVAGFVVSGNHIGSTIGIPTANLKVNDDFVGILPGVYVVRVKIDNHKYLGIANLGNNPSFNHVDNMVFETHIIDFNDNIYGKYIEVELIFFIRSEKKFNSKMAFTEQIKKDIEFAKSLSLELKLL